MKREAGALWGAPAMERDAGAMRKTERYLRSNEGRRRSAEEDAGKE